VSVCEEESAQSWDGNRGVNEKAATGATGVWEATYYSRWSAVLEGWRGGWSLVAGLNDAPAPTDRDVPALASTLHPFPHRTTPLHTCGEERPSSPPMDRERFLQDQQGYTKRCGLDARLASFKCRQRPSSPQHPHYVHWHADPRSNHVVTPRQISGSQTPSCCQSHRTPQDNNDSPPWPWLHS
jgi:hypothetical protein